MHSECEVQLMQRCADYLSELAEIYSFGGTDNRHLLRDLKAIERRAHRAEADTSFRPTPSGGEPIRWVDDIEQALLLCGGRAHLSKIESTARRIRLYSGRSWPKNADACIRDTLERHCAESMKYTGGPNLFEMVERGSGYWKLRNTK